MTDSSPPSLGTEWLVELFTDSGLDAEQARAAATAAHKRLVRGLQPLGGRGPRTRLGFALARNPLLSFNRLVGVSDATLPFMDEIQNRLSDVALATAISRAGIDADVALAFAKVTVELLEPEEFFQPVWKALGQEGDVDLTRLRSLDWSVLNPAGTKAAVQRASSRSATRVDRRPASAVSESKADPDASGRAAQRRNPTVRARPRSRKP